LISLICAVLPAISAPLSLFASIMQASRLFLGTFVTLVIVKRSSSESTPRKLVQGRGWLLFVCVRLGFDDEWCWVVRKPTTILGSFQQVRLATYHHHQQAADDLNLQNNTASNAACMYTSLIMKNLWSSPEGTEFRIYNPSRLACSVSCIPRSLFLERMYVLCTHPLIWPCL
jgi:hypothetical protein